MGTTSPRVRSPWLAAVEEHGWQSTHTVIEVVLPDRAFILQSMTMEINRYGFVNLLVLHPVYWVRRDAAGKLRNVHEITS
ncbi:NAD-glutamate dehydrogenase domain-containing protein [Bathymodiolus platifrons methanotrophic gill symbiont]|uniref:NAD-glutamate dehydrogenase domain-containing protein n=1 Tax=Bathymodiolus platifrons methanotrophic gill symbiont TaxID=113268 RepID=UPI001C8D31D0